MLLDRRDQQDQAKYCKSEQLETEVIPAGAPGEVITTCDDDEVVTGGVVAQSTQPPNEINSRIRDRGVAIDQPNSWQVQYFNPGPNPVTLEAHAECTKLP